MNVLLVFPPASILPFNIKGASPPLGIAYLAAFLRENGHRVQILDAVAEGFDNEVPEGGGMYRYGLSFEEIEARIRSFRPDVVGISGMFSIQFHNVEAVARVVRRVDPKIVTVVGGVHPTLFPRETLENPDLDYVVLGQGEHTLAELLDALAGRRSLEGIRGLGYRRNGSIHLDEDHPLIEDLDALPWPARDLLPMETYFRIGMPHGGIQWRKPVTTVVTSRGCTLACGFCNASVFWRNRIRYRSPEKVVQEMQHLIDTYGIRELHFEDDNLLLSRDRALELFERMAERSWDLVWNAPNGLAPWKMDDELIEAMARSGCYEVPLAIESGSQEVLDRVIRKPVKLERMPGVVRKIQAEGMFAHAFLIVGFPGETAEQTQATLDLPARLGLDDTTFAIFVPIPRTRLFEEAVRRGQIDPETYSFRDIHMHAAISGTEAYGAEELMRMLARKNLRMKLRLLLRPRIFYRRYLRVLFRSPRFFRGYATEWLRRLVAARRRRAEKPA